MRPYTACAHKSWRGTLVGNCEAELDGAKGKTMTIMCGVGVVLRVYAYVRSSSSPMLWYSQRKMQALKSCTGVRWISFSLPSPWAFNASVTASSSGRSFEGPWKLTCTSFSLAGKRSRSLEACWHVNSCLHKSGSQAAKVFGKGRERGRGWRAQ